MQVAAPASPARCLLSPEEARARLDALGFAPAARDELLAHFAYAEARGNESHGFGRIEWLETFDEIDPGAVPCCVEATESYERWDGNGALGYLTLAAIVEAQLTRPPEHARLVVAAPVFPTGALGYWVRRLAERGL